MKKLLLSTLTLVLIFSLAGWATETRVLTLGDANNIVKDEANITLYPNTINMYRDIVLGEFDSGGLYSIGGHYNFGDDRGVVGLYLNSRGLGVDPAVWPSSEIDNRLQMFYGRPFGDIDFGLGLEFYSDSYKRDGDVANETETSETAFGLMVGLGLLEQKLDIAAGFSMGTYTNVDSTGEDVTEPDGIMGFGVTGRYWHEFTDEVYFVPHLMFGYDKQGVKIGNDSYSETSMMFDLGWGVNIMPAEEVLFLFDFGVSYESSKESNDVELTDSKITLPYFKVGLEGQVFDWWDVRLGAVKRWNMESYDETEDIADKYNSASTSTYLGSGFHFGPLDIDIYMNDQFALNGPYFVSGNYTQLAYMTSIKYNLP